MLVPSERCVFKLSVPLSGDLEYFADVLTEFGVVRKPLLSIRLIDAVSKFRIPRFSFRDVWIINKGKA